MQPKGILAVCCVTLFAMGALSSTMGPALPNLADHTGSDLASLGALFTAVFFGSLLAQIGGGPLSDRLGQRPILFAAAVLMAVGMFGVSIGRSLWVVLAAGMLAGTGYGSGDISTNVMVSEAYPTRSVPMLNLLHMFYGIGSVTGPAFAGLLLRLWDTALPAIWLGVVVLVAEMPFILRLIPATLGLHHGTAAQPRGHSRAIYRSPVLWGLGALLMLSVGGEIGMGGWTTTYVDRTTPFSVESAALVTSGFWLALTGGRLIGSLVGGRTTSQTVLLACLSLSLVGGLLLASSTGHTLLTVAAILILGLSFGPVFPTILAIVTTTFRSGPGKAASVVIAMGSAGGMAFPWLQGVILERQGASASVLFVAILMTTMLLIYSMLRRVRARQEIGAAAVSEG